MTKSMNKRSYENKVKFTQNEISVKISK